MNISISICLMFSFHTCVHVSLIYSYNFHVYRFHYVNTYRDSLIFLTDSKKDSSTKYMTISKFWICLVA